MVRQYRADEVPAVYNIDDIPPWHARGGLDLHIFRGLDSLLSFATVEPDAAFETSPHSHPWEQVVVIVQGQIYYQVGDERVHVEAGDVFFIPPDLEHYAIQDPECEERVINLDVFPMREDYVEHTDYQTEFADADD